MRPIKVALLLISVTQVFMLISLNTLQKEINLLRVASSPQKAVDGPLPKSPLPNTGIPYGLGGGTGTLSSPGPYGIGGGTPNKQTVTTKPNITSQALVMGTVISWMPKWANTALAQLAAGSTPYYKLTKDGGIELSPGDLQPQVIAVAIFDGRQFVLLNPQTSQ